MWADVGTIDQQVPFGRGEHDKEEEEREDAGEEEEREEAGEEESEQQREEVVSLPEKGPVTTLLSYQENTKVAAATTCCGMTYCFLCIFSNDDEEDDPAVTEEEDMIEEKSIREYAKECSMFIRSMVTCQKPPAYIVDQLYEHYKNRIKDRIVDYIDARTGQSVDGPVWTKESILKHIQ